MSRRGVVVLRASAVWSVWIWTVLVRNMIEDRSATWDFRAVHITLAVISLAFAVATWRIASRARREGATGARADEPAAEPDSASAGVA